MAIHADTLLDRLHLKQQVQKWRLLAITALIVSLVVLVEALSPGGKGAGLEREYIARLTIEGVIADDKDRDRLIDELAENDRVKAVLIQLDTPGGTAVGGEELYLKLRELSKHKPVVALMRSLATSAGYMTALGADHIVARDGTITGSIGVLIQAAEFSELAEKLGVTPITVKSSPLKGEPSMFSKASPESIAALQVLIDDFYDVFIHMVAERRQLPLEEVRVLSDGRVYSGRQALKYKLIDQIGGETEALAWLKEKHNVNPDLKIKDLDPDSEHDHIFKKLSRSISSKILPDSLARLDGLVAIWHPTAQIQ